MDFTNSTVIITGGGSGIGRETALRFAQRGANIVIADIDEQAISNTKRQIASEVGSSVNVVGYETNVADTEEIEAMVSATLDRFGSIDVLINNAGISTAAVGPLQSAPEDITEAMWDELMNVNLKGAFLVAKQTIPHLRDGDGGAIVNTSSISAHDFTPGIMNYSVSKGGVDTLTKQLALDLAEDQIRVNAVCPMVTETSMTDEEAEENEDLQKMRESIPLGRINEPEDVANPILFLASDMARNITGQLLLIDGGRSL